MIKILLVIGVIVLLAIVGIILYAYLEARREAKQEAAVRASTEAWFEHYSIPVENRWPGGNAGSSITGLQGNSSINVFDGEYKPYQPIICDDGRRHGGYTVKSTPTPPKQELF